MILLEEMVVLIGVDMLLESMESKSADTARPNGIETLMQPEISEESTSHLEMIVVFLLYFGNSN